MSIEQSPYLVGNTETPSDAPLHEACPRTARPHQRPAEGNSEKSPPCRDYKRLRPPSHTISLPSVLHHLIGRFGRHRGFSTKHPRRHSMEKYILRRKHLLKTLPMIHVPEKLDMGPSGTKPSSARQDTKPNSQPLAEHCANRPSQTRQRLEPSAPSPSSGQGLTFPIFESTKGRFVDERFIA